MRFTIIIFLIVLFPYNAFCNKLIPTDCRVMSDDEELYYICQTAKATSASLPDVAYAYNYFRIEQISKLCGFDLSDLFYVKRCDILKDNNMKKIYNYLGAHPVLFFIDKDSFCNENYRKFGPSRGLKRLFN